MEIHQDLVIPNTNSCKPLFVTYSLMKLFSSSFNINFAFHGYSPKRH